MKKLIALLTAVFLLLPGCGVQKTPDTGYTKYSAQFYGTFDTVVQICQTLGIKAISSDASFYLTEDTQQLLDQYAQLDDYGRHTIASVMKVEYDRCPTQGARSTSGSDYELRPSVNVSSDLGGSSVEPLQVLSDHRSL